MTTRGYDMNDGNVKRWLRASLAYETLNEWGSPVKMGFRFWTNEPDGPGYGPVVEIEFEHPEREDYLRRIALRKRGHSTQITLNNKQLGRWRLRECRMEATISGRATKTYE